MDALKPSRLQKNDVIGVMSTSCHVPEQDVFAAEKFIEEAGYKTDIHPQTFFKNNQAAGTGLEKAAAFNDLITNKNIKAIFGSRGGNRAHTMLRKIDFNLLQNNPKIIMGYSDLTLLLNAIFAKTNLITFHGPLFRELEGHADFNQVMALLSGEIGEGNILPLDGARVLTTPDTAQGRLFGGNLSLFQTLIGTPYCPDLNGTILFLEDIGDHISRYDRMFAHLKHAGVFDKISGLIIGAFTDVKDSADNPFGFTREDIVLEHTQGLNIPIIMDAPFGHGNRLPAYPVGAHVALCGTTLTLLENVVI